MSLEGDLLLPPRGPMKWRWLAAMLDKMAKAANLISPDDSVVIAPTATGLSVRTPAQAAFDAGKPWALSLNGTRWTMNEGSIEVDGVPYTISAFEFENPSSFRILAVRIELELTAAGQLLTPRFWEPLTEYTVSSVAIELATKETIEAARSVLPGTRNIGTIYMPLATLNPFQQITEYNLQDERIYVYHQGFFIE